MAIQPEKLEFVGDFLAVRWNDGSESIVSKRTMREQCPCAQCAGEPDVTGALRRPMNLPALTDASFEVTGTERVGSYALAVTWGDGHRTGIYSWDFIRRLADLDED